jgi:CHASE2 domain-containing sensor protein
MSHLSAYLHTRPKEKKRNNTWLEIIIAAILVVGAVVGSVALYVGTIILTIGVPIAIACFALFWVLRWFGY